MLSRISMCFWPWVHSCEIVIHWFVLFYGTGTVWTASAHIITAVIGSGVLSLAWATAQLGWVAGPAVMLLFAFVTYYTSTLLSFCYRTGDPVTGKRNYTYTDAVRSNLGKFSSCKFSGGDYLKLGFFFFSEFTEAWIFVFIFQVDSRWRYVGLFSTWIFLELPLAIL